MGEHDTKKMCPRCGSYDHHTADKCNRPEIDGGGGPDNIDIEDPVKSYNTSKSNTTEVDGDGGGPGEPAMGKDYNSTRHNTSSINVEDDLVGEGGAGEVQGSPKNELTPDAPPDPQMGGDHHSTRSNTTEISVEDDLVGDGGGPGEPAMTKNYNSSKSNTSSVKGEGLDAMHNRFSLTPNEKKNKGACHHCGSLEHSTSLCKIKEVGEPNEMPKEAEGDPVGDGGEGQLDPAMRRKSAGYYGSSKSNTSSINVEDDLVGDGGGPGEPAMTKNYNSSKSNTSSINVEDDLVVDGGGLSGGGKGDQVVEIKRPGIVRKGVGKTLGLAKTMIMTAVLISVAGAGVDVYQTYNDAIAIDLEEHITDADFEMSDDKSEISGTVGFDIPQMGTFEKSIIASVHITVLESNPTTEGDYEFEYTLGSGEQFYEFTLGNLDPVTVEKIEAGKPLDLEYSGTISVTYFGVEIPSVTMDIPLTTTTVETA